MSNNLAVASQSGVSDTDLGVEFSWAPAAGLTATDREALVKAVARVPPAWLLAPREGELFDGPEAVYARLQGYALGAGFAVVKGQGSTPVRKNYWCIHHGTKTQNNRKLSESVEKDPGNPKVIRFALPCQHTLEYAYDKDIPIPLTLIHPRWWYNGPIQERAGWRPHYGHEVMTTPALVQLPRQPPSHNIVTSTNELMVYRETLSPEAQARLDADTVRLQEELLEHTKQQEVR
jgi:hypothetical protein